MVSFLYRNHPGLAVAVSGMHRLLFVVDSTNSAQLPYVRAVLDKLSRLKGMLSFVVHSELFLINLDSRLGRCNGYPNRHSVHED